jgi:hypothetical protein
LRAVEDLDDMLGNRRLDLGKVLDPAFSGGAGLSQGMVASRTMRERMDLGAIIPSRKEPSNAGMARFPSRPPLATRSRRLLIRRFHPRGGGRVGNRGWKGLLERFDLSVHLQELLDGRIFAQAVERDGLFPSQGG